ncbi:hypothetical protein LCGC14_0497870 [marine sediment metagenome]
MTRSDRFPSRLRSLWQDSRVIANTLTGMALVAYILGFRAASFPWADAIGAATAHVIPGAIACITAWRLQSGVIHKRPIWLAHGVLAIGTGLFWLAMTLAITLIAKPDIIVHVAKAASPGTLLSGLFVYTAIAFVFALIRSRQHAAESDAARARAELAAVRARVEPHFLYNTLETIAGLVRHQPKAAETAIGQLGRLLRRVLDVSGQEAGDPLIALQEELTLVRDYLAIEQLRLGDRLQVIEKIDADTHDLGFPVFGLQVLVENAILHGIAPKPDGGTISLTAAHRDGQLVLTVSDDGLGAEEAALLRGGLGLSLLRTRIETHFPGATTFDVAASPGRGVSIRIAIPAVEAE